MEKHPFDWLASGMTLITTSAAALIAVLLSAGNSGLNAYALLLVVLLLLSGVAFVVAGAVSRSRLSHEQERIGDLLALLARGQELDRDGIQYLGYHPSHLKSFREVYHTFRRWNFDTETALRRHRIDPTRFLSRGFVIPTVDENDDVRCYTGSLQEAILHQVEELASTIERLRNGEHLPEPKDDEMVSASATTGEPTG
jgi:hypothetical protein